MCVLGVDDYDYDDDYDDDDYDYDDGDYDDGGCGDDESLDLRLLQCWVLEANLPYIFLVISLIMIKTTYDEEFNHLYLHLNRRMMK